jgi:CBS domain-containing protein
VDPLTSPLGLPAGALLRLADTLGPEDSLARAALVLRETSASLVPVAREDRPIGAVTQGSLARCLEAGVDPLQPVTEALEPGVPTIPVFASGAEALRRLADSPTRELMVVDGEGRFAGLLAASDLFPRPETPPHLPLIGGMATPFGVYLTAGGAKGGASHAALVATGAMLFGMLVAASLAGAWAAEWALPSVTPKTFHTVSDLVSVGLFLIGLRLLPLSGIHAAEHQVVHALERGEPLELEVVRRMPRVHPRCGTNVAVGLGLFLSLAAWKWTDQEALRIFASLIATLFVWRPLGSLLQLLVTTRPASDRQLLNGIAAGRDLVRNVQVRGRVRIGLGRRLLSSGMPHVVGGSLLAYFVAEGIAMLFGFRIAI